LDSDKLIRDVMVYSFKTITEAANVAVTKKTAYRLILSATVLGFAACGVRGPLTLNPKPIKGLDGVATPAPTDLRAAPASAVLFGSNGKRTIIATPIATPATAPIAEPVVPAAVNPN
jgi:hypothetical protein